MRGMTFTREEKEVKYSEFTNLKLEILMGCYYYVIIQAKEKKHGKTWPNL